VGGGATRKTQCHSECANLSRFCALKPKTLATRLRCQCVQHCLVSPPLHPIHTHTHTHMKTLAHIHTLVCVHACKSTHMSNRHSIHTHTQMHTHTRMHTKMPRHTRKNKHTRVYVTHSAHTCMKPLTHLRIL